MFGNIEKFDYLLKNGAGTTGEQYNDVVDNELLLSSLTFWKDCQITIERLTKNKDDSLLLMAVRYYRPAFVKLLMEVARSPIDDLRKNKDDGKDALNVPIYGRRTHCVLKRGSQEEINLRKPIVQKMLGLSPEQAAQQIKISEWLQMKKKWTSLIKKRKEDGALTKKEEKHFQKYFQKLKQSLEKMGMFDILYDRWKQLLDKKDKNPKEEQVLLELEISKQVPEQSIEQEV